MEEYRDGSFGGINKLEAKIKEILQMPPEQKEKIAKVHIGSEEELNRILEEKQKGNLENRVDRLEMKINEILIHLGIDEKKEVLPVSKIQMEKVREMK